MQKISALVSLPPSMCQEHNLPFETYCSHEYCSTRIRVCKKCRDNHSDHLKFLTDSKQVVDDLKKGIKRCFDKIQQYEERSKQLIKLMNLAKTKSKQEYEQMEASLIAQMQMDKQILDQTFSRMTDVYDKIQEKQKIQTYFTKLQKNNLLQLRIKLSSEQGMISFKQKNEKLCESMQKSKFQQLQKLKEEFQHLVFQFDYYLENSSSFKVSQIVALKNSKKKQANKNSLKDNTKENIQKQQDQKIKQKKKPKTTLNFGEGIISGILNFLNF